MAKAPELYAKLTDALSWRPHHPWGVNSYPRLVGSWDHISSSLCIPSGPQGWSCSQYHPLRTCKTIWGFGMESETRISIVGSTRSLPIPGITLGCWQHASLHQKNKSTEYESVFLTVWFESTGCLRSPGGSMESSQAMAFAS